jgi:hypothetical protein
LRQEVFFLAYHLHWSHSEAVDLPVGDRWAYVRLLIDQLEREKSEIEEART